ncbi:MAG: hypothetical protein K9H26_19365 [Prolixibacteraceae bacterium]|nr:hypothetical protein [Prolixibacteraceae bacterium]
MKPKKLKTLSTFLLLLPLCVVFLGAGCEDSYENVYLEYTKCPCDSETEFIKEVTMDKIMLFDTTKTTLSEMQELSLVGDSSCFVCYKPEINNAVYYLYKGLIQEIGLAKEISYICNFPEIAGEWEIPSDGIVISYSADVFKSCKSVGSIGGWTSFTDNILVSLKKYNK